MKSWNLLSLFCIVGATTHNIPWPATSNIGPNVQDRDSVFFEWTGLHNVVQVEYWQNFSAYSDPAYPHKWPTAIGSGAKSVSTTNFLWTPSAQNCRPGLYYFIDQDNPSMSVFSLNFVVTPINSWPDSACSSLGGKYSNRVNCTVREVTNFQTAGYDWQTSNGVDTVVARQGDLVRFRWSGIHNVIQVHDVHQDTQTAQPASYQFAAPAMGAGALKSGVRGPDVWTNPTICVPGPNFQCINAPNSDSVGVWIWDTTDYRPGTYHFSDECICGCMGCDQPPSKTGMNTQVFLTRPTLNPSPQVGACCKYKPSKGADCRLLDLYNDADGMQFQYNEMVRPTDLVRFRWAGNLKIYQSQPVSASNSAPSNIPTPGGAGMAVGIECTPGPREGCLQPGITGEWIFDPEENSKTKTCDPFNQCWFGFYYVGESIDGYTSNSGGTIVGLSPSTGTGSNATCPPTQSEVPLHSSFAHSLHSYKWFGVVALLLSLV